MGHRIYTPSNRGYIHLRIVIYPWHSVLEYMNILYRLSPHDPMIISLLYIMKTKTTRRQLFKYIAGRYNNIII